MDITKFKFPEMSDLDIAFSNVRTDKDLLTEAKRRGFYGGHTKYNDLFRQLFYKGGQIIFKKDLDEEFRVKATRYLKAFIGSFEPSHEDKEAVSALILSELTP